jgi:hypothetical protein
MHQRWTSPRHRVHFSAGHNAPSPGDEITSSKWGKLHDTSPAATGAAEKAVRCIGSSIDDLVASPTVVSEELPCLLVARPLEAMGLRRPLRNRNRIPPSIYIEESLQLVAEAFKLLFVLLPHWCFSRGITLVELTVGQNQHGLILKQNWMFVQVLLN